MEHCNIFILDPKEGHVWLQCGTGVQPRQIKVPKWSSMVGSVISSGDYKIEYNMENNSGIHDTVDLRTGFTTRNSLSVPIRGVSTDNVTGAIQVLNKNPGESYTDNDRELLEKVAFNIQVAIESMYVRQEAMKISEEIENRIELFGNNLQRTFS